MQPASKEAVVAATRSARIAARRALRAVALAGTRLAGLLGGVLAASHAQGADLPEDRADLMFHSYNGGGVSANGPALLVRKSVTEAVSLSASYYVDMVSNASIDVVTTASPYKETREEHAGSLDFVYKDALISLAADASKEPDYSANRASIDVAQDLWGGMTTVNLGYTRGWDTVGNHNDPSFSQQANHWQYRLGATQILTARWLMSANVEAISDQGYLGSPYRAALVFGARVKEIDPSTRTSRAIALRSVLGLGDDGALHAQYRYFWDTWAIRARTVELGYSKNIERRWLLDGTLRYYSQGHASFYSDDFTSAVVYRSRNRQLGSFHDLGLGVKASWTALQEPGRYEVKLNAALDHMSFHYSDFTDIRTGGLYSFNANVLELYVSANF